VRCPCYPACDPSQPTYLGRPYQEHDALVDITNGSDLVTVSYSWPHDHDKTMLIGSSDSRTTGRGKLRVTIHHNLFTNPASASLPLGT
jgi:pectate lyase